MCVCLIDGGAESHAHRAGRFMCAFMVTCRKKKKKKKQLLYFTTFPPKFLFNLKSEMQKKKQQVDVNAPHVCPVCSMSFHAL